MNRRLLISMFVLMLCAVSCKRPPSMEYYVFNDGSGRYEYEIDMTDSLRVYDLSFYTRIDRSSHPAGFPMKVYMTSPSGQTYVENIYYQLSGDPVVLYRQDLRPVEYGKWTMTVHADVDFITGLGLIAASR